MSMSFRGIKKLEQPRFKPSADNIFIKKNMKHGDQSIKTQPDAYQCKKQEMISVSKNISSANPDKQYEKIILLSLKEELQIRIQDGRAKNKTIAQLEEKIAVLTKQNEQKSLIYNNEIAGLNEKLSAQIKKNQLLEQQLSLQNDNKEKEILSLKEENDCLRQTAETTIQKFNEKSKMMFLLNKQREKQIKQLNQRLQKYAENEEQYLFQKQIALKLQQKANNSKQK